MTAGKPRVVLKRRSAEVGRGEVMDAGRRGRKRAIYVRLDGQPGQVYRLDRVVKRTGIFYLARARSLRRLGKLSIEPIVT